MDTTKLLAKIKQAIVVPSYNGRYSDDDILDLATEEQCITVVPIITSLRSEFFVVKEQQTVLASNNELVIPVRAVGRTLRSVKYNTNGTVVPMARIQIENEHYYSSMGEGSPAGFYVEGDRLVVIPTPVANATFDIWYEKKPSILTKTTSTAIIQSIVKTNGVDIDGVVVNKVSSGIVANVICDITKATAGYTITNQDVEVQNVAGLTITFKTFVTNVNIGDSVSLANYTSIVQLPEEATLVLVHSTALRILEGLGIPEQSNIAEKILLSKIKHLQEAVTPRVEGNRQKVLNNNGLVRNRVNRRFPSVTV